MQGAGPPGPKLVVLERTRPAAPGQAGTGQAPSRGFAAAAEPGSRLSRGAPTWGAGGCPEKQKGRTPPGDCGQQNQTDEQRTVLQASVEIPLLRSVVFEFALELAAAHRA